MQLPVQSGGGPSGQSFDPILLPAERSVLGGGDYAAECNVYEPAGIQGAAERETLARLVKLAPRLRAIWKLGRTCYGSFITD